MEKVVIELQALDYDLIMTLIALAASTASLIAIVCAFINGLIVARRKASRRRFLSERQMYEAKRVALNRRAVAWYGHDVHLIGTTSQITCPGWIPTEGL